MDNFKISATGLSINYMPEYLARELGYFEEQGIEVTSYVPAPWTKVLTDINSGEYQAVVGGIWVPSIYQNRIKNYYAFAKVSSRCPLILVGRQPAEAFDWKLLEDKVVLVTGGNGASPGMFLSGCAKEGGADLSKIHFVHDFSAPMLFECFKGGMGDMVFLKSNLAAQLIEQGYGYQIADLSVEGGAVPWSVYYSVPEFLEREDNLAGRFTLALQKGTDWLLSHSGYDCREILSRNWPELSEKTAVDMVDHFIRTGMWDKTVSVKEGELARWEQFMADSHVIDRPLSMDEIFDPRPFAYAAKALGITE